MLNRKRLPPSLTRLNRFSTRYTHTHYFLSPIKLILLLFILPGLLTSGCSNPTSVVPTPAITSTPAPTPYPQSMVTFRVQIPSPLSSGEAVYLNTLDEVTGLALNTQSYLMSAEDPTHYYVILPFTFKSVIKYRYTRQGSIFAQEHIADGRPVRYRMYYVDGPGVVKDIISRWTDTKFNGPTGRISGQVTDSKSNLPIPNILVTAGGAQTLTASDGSYLIEGLPVGTHNVVAYSLDAAYQTYQQGAVIAADSTTPAPLHMVLAARVKIVFSLTVPKGTYPAIPIRMAGDLYQLGNTFADLTGGISTIASRMPVLKPLPDGRYTITLNLPAGAAIHYKYTLGDGIWNAEYTSGGGLNLRQLIVPETSQLIDDHVYAWNAGKATPITFDINVPTNTPAGESVSIQFNPGYGWMEPISMWPVGNNRWIYVLFSPLDTKTSLHYRFCRNDQCGSADDSASIGPDTPGEIVTLDGQPKTVKYQVKSWAWLQTINQTEIVTNTQVQARGQRFMAGVEFQAFYHPNWQSRLHDAIKDVQSMQSNWIVFTPTWSFTRLNLPVLELVPGRDALWTDLVETISQAKSQSLNVALFPTPNFPGAIDQWWESGTRDFAWWKVWFERYRTFILDHADLAARQGVSALILGGDWVSPALPGGKLANGAISGVPEDAEARWRNLLAEVRSHFKGTLQWALPYPQGIQSPPIFLDTVDQIYLLWSAPLAKQPGASEADMTTEAAKLLKDSVVPFQGKIGKPVVLGIAYPSAKGGATDCIATPAKTCLDPQLLGRPNPDIPQIALDLQEEARAYSAMMASINETQVISGVVSRGYYPPVILRDKSLSVHSKPAGEVLLYWFSRLVGSPAP